jgi:alpha-galactosidase
MCVTSNSVPNPISDLFRFVSEAQRLCCAYLLFFAFVAQAEVKSEWVVSNLPAYQEESGLVTEKELQLADRWMQSVTRPVGGKFTAEEPLDHWLGAALPFSFYFDGKEAVSRLEQWQLREEENTADSESEQRQLTWTDPSSGLCVCWRVKHFKDFPAVEWVLQFENRGKTDSPILEHIQDLDFKVQHSPNGESFSVHGAHGGRYMRDDWWPFSRDVPATIAGAPDEISLGGGYPSSRRDLPFFNLETPDDRGMIVGVGWTGSWSGHVQANSTEADVRVGLTDTHFILHPGEKIRTARILLVFWEGKRMHGQNMLRQLLHRYYIPRLNGRLQEPLVSVNTCFTYHGNGEFLDKATEKELLPLVQPFVKLGFEAFIIDAGWYDGSPWIGWVGNWHYSKSKYPGGFRPISDPLNAADVAFGLWFAPEMLSQNSPLLQEHPDWANGADLRLELPQAREWFLAQVDELVKKEGMRLYRQDGMNSYANLHDNEPSDRRGLAEIKYIMGLYEMLDTLRSRHPDLIMEAAVGAPRIDLETLSRFHWHQPCETWGRPDRDQCMLYGASLWLPGGMIIPYMQALDDYGVWSAFAGQLCLGWHPLDPDFPFDRARLQVARYKRIRPFLSGDFYPLTPVSLKETWMGYQFHRTDLDGGFALVFKRFEVPRVIYTVTDGFRLHLRGVEPHSLYQVHFEERNKDEQLTGQALASGIDVILGKAPSAEMIVYRKSGGGNK